VADEFESAEFLAARAAKQANEFQPLADRFFREDNTVARVVEFDPETGGNVVKIRLLKPLSADLRGLASDALKNFRDSLDQAVFAAAKVIKGKGNKRCHFPFGESPTDLENSLTLRLALQCRGIPEELFPALRACMPYPRGDGYAGGNDALRALHRVSGPHKHEVTLAVGAHVGRTELSPGTFHGGTAAGSIFVNPGWDNAKNEMKLFSFSPGGYFDTDVTVTMLVVFGPGPLEKVSVDDFLRTLAADIPIIVERIKTAALAAAAS
jgi:hypothetical protein